MLKRNRSRLLSSRGSRSAALKPTNSDASYGRPHSGNAHQVFEKYVTLAREALTTGDRIMAEGYYQHAEHYLRVMNETQSSRNEKAFLQEKEDVFATTPPELLEVVTQ